MATINKGSTEHRVLIYPRFLSRPEDLLSFVQLPSFESHWKKLRLTDDDLRELEMCLMVNPLIGEVVKRTGGLRKMRAVPDSWHMGKRGALRVCYAYFPDLFIVILAAAYGKNRKDDLSEEERRFMRKLIPLLHEDFSQERRKQDA